MLPWARAGLVEGGLARLRAVKGGVGKPRAPERWPENSRTVEGSLELQNGGLRGLEEAWDDFLIEACFY